MFSSFQRNRVREIAAEQGFENYCMGYPEGHFDAEPQYHGPIAVLYYASGHLQVERLGQQKTLLAFCPI